MQNFVVDKLNVKIMKSRAEMGQVAASDIARKIKELCAKKSEINVIFAAAPSQNEVLENLIADKAIEWEKINAYHMDEYIGLSKDAPQSFGNFLKAHIFEKVPFKSVNYIDITASDPEFEALRYGKLVKENSVDIVVMGIGENGHIAFNDPPVADFQDDKIMKAVKLDRVCREQQVHDGCFAKLEDVPEYALTLTVPTLMSAPYIFCIVPGPTKAKAVCETLKGIVDEHCPASILRMQKEANLYLDDDSAKLL